MSDLLEKIRHTRRDTSPFLYHFTKSRRVYDCDDPIKRKVVKELTSYENLIEILKSGQLNGTLSYVKGADKCICFSETPLPELAAIMIMEDWKASRYDTYGIAVRKDWVYQLGGRPVIYQSDAEFQNLPPTFHYRHVRYEPGTGIDFTWEREWRVKADNLTLDAESMLAIVPYANEAFDLMNMFKEWNATSLELLLTKS